MPPPKPTKTLADYLVIGVSPVLIMFLVGSLSFFLIECFFRGETVGSVRWVVFWFVLAVVLVARIGIEEGSGKATVFGLALAAATWLYLVQIHPAFIMGMILLAVVWWCANKLTRDCTLIDDDDDASGSGLLQGDLWWRKSSSEQAAAASSKPKPVGTTARNPKLKQRAAAPHRPGLSLVYFSLAALPLFGIGQRILPAGDTHARHVGFALLLVYLAAALGLLLTTSFLGLRRYLRQRLLAMPGTIALGWVRFGVSVAVTVLAMALLLPRPGAMATWTTLRLQIDHYIRQASEYAASSSPHGKGQGRPGSTPSESADQDGREGTGQDQENEQPGAQASQRPASANQQREPSSDSSPSESRSSAPTASKAERLQGFFKVVLLVTGALLLICWLVRRRHLIAEIARSLIAALGHFFRNLFRLEFTMKRSARSSIPGRPTQRVFRAYENPFVTGRDRVWPPEQVILYSYEALQVWAGERGHGIQSHQTAREFCHELGDSFPEVEAELKRLSVLYGQAAFGLKLPQDWELDSLGRLWRFISEPSVASVA